MNKKFDFSEIDGALPTAEKMQEQDRIIDALKNNYEAVRILSANVEKLENRLSEKVCQNAHLHYFTHKAPTFTSWGFVIT